MTISGQYDIEVEPGSDLAVEIQHKSGETPTDLTGATGVAACRTWARGEPLCALTVTITDATAGRFTISAPAAETAVVDRSGVYEVQFTGIGDWRAIHGRLIAVVGVDA